MMSTRLKRRLDKLGAELPTFEEWLGPSGWIEMDSAEAKSAFKKGPPYPWREGTEKTYLKKLHERLVAIMAARVGDNRLPRAPLSLSPMSDDDDGKNVD